MLLLGVSVLFVGCSRSAGVGDSIGSTASNESPLLVYCAAGIRLPVEAAAKQYEEEFGRKIQIDYGSSGELEGRLEIDKQAGKSRCDLYIPADTSFSQRARQKQLTVEQLVLAKFRLVLGLKSTASSAELKSVDDLLQSGMSYTICDPKAGVGKKTMTTLERSGKWAVVDEKKKAAFPRVTEAANAIQTSNDVDAGFIWDTTATQFGLSSVVLEEIKDAVSTITVNVVSSTKRPTSALHFARYLAASDKGQTVFPKHGFEPAGTDAWAEKPTVVLYCGGVNRNAIDATLREFELREGVSIQEHYGGCGTLIAGIIAAKDGTSKKGVPDAFMTCDASYMEKVQPVFRQPSDVSSTGIVLLVRKGNPKGLRSIEDLSHEDLAIGTTNPKMSTLGDLTWQLFESNGVQASIERNQSVSVMTPTAHELIMQMTGHDKLDVALVYEANCQNLSDDFEIVRIEDSNAIAVQNIATSIETLHPALASRLVDAIQSAPSQKRFELQGFKWRAMTKP